MKLFLATLLVFISGINHTLAQEMETLFDGDVTHGGFGGPMVKFDEIRDDLAVWVGGRGGWIVNLDPYHAIRLGGGGYGLVTNHSTDYADTELDDPVAAGGYGGFVTEYTNRSYRLLHVTATTLIGAGGLTLRERQMHEVDHDRDANAFFVIEPGVNLELNITSFLRIAAGVNYRLTSGIDLADYRDSEFSGLNANVIIKFGSFR